jgi:hypothetical protein
MNGASSEIRDRDLRQVEIALRRAAAKARELGRMTGTPVFVFRQGKIVDLTREAELQRPASPSAGRASTPE